MNEHRVSEGGFGENIPHRDAFGDGINKGIRGVTRELQPDRLATRRKGCVGNRKAERFGDCLCGSSGSEELTSAAGGRAGPAASFGSFLESDQAMGKSGPDGLDESGILAVLRGKRDASWDNGTWAVMESGESHHHCGQAFVAGRNPHHSLAGWQ
jgi:hypothetical protein